ncbi:hypothetical protein DFH06DRAFT_1486918 [Mycena polygramma]|nr:hypothetical protein DFH06DRAFT_1486918 [Mycena polygramma]
MLPSSAHRIPVSLAQLLVVVALRLVSVPVDGILRVLSSPYLTISLVPIVTPLRFDHASLRAACALSTLPPRFSYAELPVGRLMPDVIALVSYAAVPRLTLTLRLSLFAPLQLAVIIFSPRCARVFDPASRSRYARRIGGVAVRARLPA